MRFTTQDGFPASLAPPRAREKFESKLVDSFPPGFLQASPRRSNPSAPRPPADFPKRKSATPDRLPRTALGSSFARGKTESRDESASPTSLRWRPSPAIDCEHTAAGDQKSCFRDYFCFDRRKLFHGERLKGSMYRSAREDANVCASPLYRAERLGFRRSIDRRRF
jgi:hypothetical protein